MKKIASLLMAFTLTAVAEEPVVTGNGPYTFQIVPGWGLMPEGKNIGPTHGGVAVDAAGQVYVSTDAEHGVVVFNKDGSFKTSWGSSTSGVHALAIHKEGDAEFLYGAQVKRNRFVKMDLNGEIVLKIPNENTGTIPGGYKKTNKEGKEYDVPALKGITGVAVSADGHIFLSCGYGSNLVHKFDSTGKIIKTFGGKGRDNVKFRTCHGLAIDNRFGAPRLLVVDRENGRLMHYDLDFNFISQYSHSLRRPCAVSIRGDQCVVGELQGRVTLLGKSGFPLAFLGDNPDKSQWAKFATPKAELKTGFFTAVHGLSFDGDGNVIAQDWNQSGRVTKLILKK